MATAPPPPPPVQPPRAPNTTAPPSPPQLLTSVTQNADLPQPKATTSCAPEIEESLNCVTQDGEEPKVQFDEDVERVPTEFVWSEDYENKVKEVQVSGAWNGWIPIDMFHESQGVWSVITSVPVGTHEFKYVIDGDWRVSEMHPFTDGGGDRAKINNIRVVSGRPKDYLPKHSIYHTMKNSRCCTII